MSNMFDITISREAAEKKGMTEEAIIAWMKANCKKWALGRETGDQGYEHYQVRVETSLEKGTMINVFSGVGHVSITSARDYDYILKDGNYVASWLLPIYKYANIELREWQRDVKARFAMQDDRKVLVVIDQEGGAGKSYLAKHLEANALATVIPKMSRADDMISACMVNPSDGYVFDIPRAEDKKSVPLWTAIEQIKSGHLYDWRYQFRRMWIEPPRILVFSNTEPPWDYLSKDRWETVRIEQEVKEIPETEKLYF